MTKTLNPTFLPYSEKNMIWKVNCQDIRANYFQSHLLTCQIMLEYLSPKEQLSAAYMEYNNKLGP